MLPQGLNDQQSQLLEQAASASERYLDRYNQRNIASELLDNVMLAVLRTGVSKSRVAEELGFSVQEIDERLDPMREPLVRGAARRRTDV